jgi:CelD/BcsL family acetyltransferase involved in cellulose biosynthesis
MSRQAKLFVQTHSCCDAIRKESILPSDIRADVLRTRQQFRALEPAWNTLLANSSANTLCASWDWLDTWCDVFGNDIDYAVITVREDDTLIGVAPFWVERTRMRGLPVRMLRFLGTGEAEAEEVCSEYLDLIAVKGRESDVADAVAQTAVATIDWDVMELRDCTIHASAATALADALNGVNIQCNFLPQGAGYRIALRGDLDATLEALPPSARQRLLYKRRKLARAGTLQWSSVSSQTQIDGALNALAQMHGSRWAARGQRGAFVSDRFRAFHLAFCRRQMSKGTLAFHALTLEGKPLATLLNYRWAGVEYFYQSGIDTHMARGQSPGLVAHVLAIEHAIAAGMHTYDLMRAEVGSYKLALGATGEAMGCVRACNRTASGQVVRRFQAAKAALRG